MPRIITLSCSTCGTVVAGNVLENHRELKCPGLDCESVLRFSDLDDADKDHLLNNVRDYRMED